MTEKLSTISNRSLLRDIERRFVGDVTDYERTVLWHGAAWFFLVLFGYYILRPIRELQEVVGDIASGQLDRRLGWQSGDERGEIAGAINRLARTMRESIDTAQRQKLRLEAVLSSMVE